ncbi:MAG: hypothetical protein AAFY56_24000 [Pseudomonadota bacterium]
MRTLLASAALSLAMALCSPAYAVSDSQLVKITGLDIELSAGGNNGLVRIWVDQAIVATPNCQYPTIAYLLESHPGFDTMMAALLTAHSTAGDVKLQVEGSCWIEPWGANAPRYHVRAVKMR